MGVSPSTRQAYSEVDSFLGLLDEVDRNKIPIKLRNLFKKEKDKNYIKNIEVNIPIAEQNLKEETLGIIALLNLKYWCEDEEEKERLRKRYARNERIYKEELEKSYGLNEVFQINEEEEGVYHQVIECRKEKRYLRIWNKIKKFFDK